MEHALLPERIASRIVVDATSGCWLWTGYCTIQGYGQVSWDGNSRLVHRVVWNLLVGEIPPQHVLDHLVADRPLRPGPCRHRNCCNPAHLEPVTVDINSQRVVNWHSTKTVCPQGHSYAVHGKVYACKDGGSRRFCMECRRIRDAARKESRKQQVGHAPASAPVARFRGPSTHEWTAQRV